MGDLIVRDHCTSSTHPEASPKPQSPRPHSSLAWRQAWPQVGCRRGSESMASMAAARRQVGKREETVFGNERRARSPASAASRFCSEMKTSQAIAQEKRPGCGHASVPARACRSPASCPPTQRGLCAGVHRCVSVSPASLRPVSSAGTNSGAGRPAAARGRAVPPPPEPRTAAAVYTAPAPSAAAARRPGLRVRRRRRSRSAMVGFGGLYSVTALRKTTMRVTVYTKHRLTLQNP